MIKKISAFVLSFILAMGCLHGVYASTSRSLAEAAYGTPEIDGAIDSVWDKTNYYIVNHNPDSGQDYYKGWFKVLWDEKNLYILTKYYEDMLVNGTGTAYKNDSIDIYIDEKREYQAGLREDDYQIRSDFEGNVSGSNYKEPVTVKTTVSDEGFIMEMAFPLHTINTKENLKLGFEVMMTSAEKNGIEMRLYNWNCKSEWKWNNTDRYGELVLKKNVSVREFAEPEYKKPEVKKISNPKRSNNEVKVMEGITTFLDGTPYNYPIIELGEYPAMAIDDMAEMIGGRVENGNTLIRDDDPKTSWDDSLKMTYYIDEQLAEDSRGRVVLERRPVIHQGRMFIPISTLENTLGWTKYYNKFGKTLEISTGTNYPDTELVVYARDYGAVGDGVHNDLPAILEAIDIATSSGVPSKVELDPGKTYLLGPRNDAQSLIQLLYVENFIFDGMGSELLAEKTANSFLEMRFCTNVQIKNLEFDYKEMMFTQGRVTMVDHENGKFRMIIDEGYPLPPANDWVINTFDNPDTNLDRWAFGIIVDRVADRSKFNSYNSNFIDEVHKVKGTAREYEIIVTEAGKIVDLEVQDRFVINMGFRAYDIPYKGLEVANNTSGILIKDSGDVNLENIKYYQTQWQGCFLSENWGRVRFIGYKNITKPGRLLCCNSDGIYDVQSRFGPIIIDSEIDNALDDHLNFHCSRGYLRKVASDNEIDGYVYATNMNFRTRPGDELLFVNQETRQVQNAFVKKCERRSDGLYYLTVDRQITDLRPGTKSDNSVTLIFSNDSSCKSAIVRDSVFMNSRRNAMLVMSPNTMYDGNKIYDECGSAVNVAGEIIERAGPYPHAFTFRNNYMKFDGEILGNGPVYVHVYGNVAGDPALIENVLIENNIIDANPKTKHISVESVNGLWLKNNTITCSQNVGNTHKPVVISNSRIEEIDGVYINYTSNIDAAVTISGCEVDETNIKNIEFLSPNTAQKVLIQ